MVQDAVLRNLQVIGEAEFRGRIPLFLKEQPGLGSKSLKFYLMLPRQRRDDSDRPGSSQRDGKSTKEVNREPTT
ncbi:TPA: hypothetical protein DIT45_04775 [Candidatus Acetothermia bacterium]|nr:hypothetical protein [Candidatus Acetothermia bacterium]